jgi:hypothetical protein
MTVLQMCTASLKRLGVLGEGETPTAEMGADYLERLNDYINDQLTNDRLAIFAITRTVFDLANGTASYTVGLGGTVNVARPATMNMQGCNVTFIDTSASNPTQELPLWSLTDDAYQAIVQKDYQATYPTSWYYNPTYTSSVAPYGTLTFWPVPNVSTLDGVFYAPAAVQEFTSLSQTIALPPGYRRFLRDNLAVEIAPEYTITPSESLLQSARESKASVLSVNTRISDLGVDLALVPQRQRSNIYSGNC